MTGFSPDSDSQASFRPSSRRVYSVTEVTREMKRTLEGAFFSILVEGEVSNLKYHGSGHLYFSLKDSESQIACVLWRGRSRNLRFRLQDGMQIRVAGDLTVYERQGKVQIDVQQVLPVGQGELQAAFDALKSRLAAEGLFEPGHKQPLPFLPKTVGVVTSATGAALRDIVSVIRRRCPSVGILLCPVTVQGVTAAGEISEAIAALNAQGQADVLIVGRGGGSLEDLWAFNEEIVARAIFASRIPVISAVGHETDFSIADFVADVRAATPSAAAELAVPDAEALTVTLHRLRQRMGRQMRARLDGHRMALAALQKSYGLRWPGDRLREYGQRLDELARQLRLAQRHSLKRRGLKLDAVAQTLAALDPHAVLRRGYSITTDASGRVIREAGQLKPGEHIVTRLGTGRVGSVVETIDQ